MGYVVPAYLIICVWEHNLVHLFMQCHLNENEVFLGNVPVILLEDMKWQ